MEGKPVNGSSSSSSSWVVEMEKVPADTVLAVMDVARWNKISIYRVPEWIKKMTKSEAYKPRLVSLGPFHHGDDILKPMEEHKRRAVMHIVKRSGKPFSEFRAANQEVADQLLDAYEDLDEKWRGANREEFVNVMVTDGSFLLEIMKGLADQKAPEDYAPNDPVFSVHGMVFLWASIRADMAVIENQMPLLALHKLEAVWPDPNYASEEKINRLVLNFLCDPLNEGKFKEVDVDNLFLHPLDVFHKSFCILRPGRQQEGPMDSPGPWERCMSSALELNEVGIHLRKSKTESFRDIEFKNGVLHLPSFSIHDGTEKIFLNLMAFERLHPDAGSEATAFLIFMDNIIDSERDVQLLRSKGIIKNLLSSDKEAANLFNILSKGLLPSPFDRLNAVRQNVNAHCRKPWNRWRAFFMHAYLRNPCLFISLMAAVILLIATLLQTVYSVMAFYK